MRQLICSICVLIPLLAGQELPGCDAKPEVLRALNVDLSNENLGKLKWVERRALEDQVVKGLIARYPREVVPHLRLIQDVKWSDPQRLPGIQAHYRQMAAEHPEDPLALVLAAQALFETDTPESLRLAQAARLKAPQFSYAALLLADEWSGGLHAANNKFADNLRAYFAMCPASADSMAHYLLPKLADQALQASVAGALRAALANVTDVTLLGRYSTLWALEFRATPPAGHDALRKQVGEDVKRLEALKPHADSDFFELLTSGHKQSGASRESLTAFEDRIVRELASSPNAFQVVSERWKKANPEPESQTDLSAWNAYNAAYLKKIREWKPQFPRVRQFLGEEVHLMFEDKTLNEAEGVAKLEALLKQDMAYQEPFADTYLNAASMLLRKKWRPQRALELLALARPLAEAERSRTIANDNYVPSQRKMRLEYVDYSRQAIAACTLRAATLSNKPEAAEPARAIIEAPLAQDARKSSESRYWQSRAILASVDRRQADALAFYQMALRARPEAPKAYHGKLKDPLLDDVKELWKQLGGTDTAFTLWTAAGPAAAGEELKLGRWEKPVKELPSFELSDLSGKTWKLKSLEGKTVLINLWATWCGPCKGELLQFQKLYERVKDRADVQVITFNIDDQLGLVAPFVKENGYTFPVLLAYEFTRGLLEGIAIPQNWIIDTTGKWRLTQIGYGAEPDWPGEMLKKLEGTK